MSIAGPLYRRSPRLFNKNKPGDWTFVWCELHEDGQFIVYADPPQLSPTANSSGDEQEAAKQAPIPTPSAAPARKLLSIPIGECDVAHVRIDGRDSFEITLYTGAKKETFSSHESSYDVDWWMNTLLAVKRDLARGVRPRLSIVCPPSGESEPTREVKSKRRPPSLSNSGNNSTRHGLQRRQPTLEAMVTRFERFTIYETPSLFYVVCSDRHYSRFRMFSLDRTVEQPTLLSQVLLEDPELYTWTAMEDKLQALAEQCRTSGIKLVRAFTAVAIIGCIRFLRGYYFTFVTQRRKIGCIGGNFIYGISATQQVNVCKPSEQEGASGSAWMWFNRWFNPSPEEEAEARYLGLFHFIDLTKDFFFSYSYDVTHTLQHNMTTEHSEPAEAFTWNEYLTRELKTCLTPSAVTDLVLPIVLGSYEQRKCSVFGRLVSITLLARRSRHFAGTRYLKRGVADTGKAANDVETEQIIEDESMGAGKFSSFVQYRGSIPVFWSQETSATLPKPPIVLNRVDPTYSSSRKHFSDLFSRYGSPIVVLNLVKQSEKKEREVIVGTEFMNAVEYLNNFIPAQHRIRYVALDYSRLSKQKGLNVLHSLDKVAVWALTQTGFFCSEPKRQIVSSGTSTAKESGYVSFASSLSSGHSLRRPSQEDEEPRMVEPPASPTIPRQSGEWLEQKGVLRTNCIDCLDRTNVSQFSVGMRALGQQLYAMGIRNTPLLESRSQLVRVLMLLYSLVGDAISMQYGGSEAHKNVQKSAQRENVKHLELLNTIRRYYNNSFTDMAKQDAINIFLGHFVPREGYPPLWEMESDYYLHNFEVRNGATACDMVRHTLAKQAESKRKAMSSVPSGLDLRALANEHDKDDSDNDSYQAGMTTKDRRRREAYAQECKRLLEDWWREPLEQFERPKFTAKFKRRSFPTKKRDVDLRANPLIDNSKTITIDATPVMLAEEESAGENRPRKSLSVGTSDTFLQMYHPEELTSFEKTLGYKFMSPMDLSSESNADDKPRARSSTASTIDPSGEAIPARPVSADEVSVDLTSVARRSSRPPALTTKGVRSMSAPDIGDESDLFVQQKRHVEFSAKQGRIDENEPMAVNGDLRQRRSSQAGDMDGRCFGDQPSLAGRSMTIVANQQQPPQYKSALKRKDEQITIEEYVQSRSNKNFIGDCSMQVVDPVYERYVHWNRNQAWERDNESVKIYFESYLRDNNISVDDARALRDAQVRGGATFKVQVGPYAGLDQNVKARVLVAKKLKTDPDDRRIFEDSMDYKKLMSAHKSTIHHESIELYKSFFDEPLPHVDLYSDTASKKQTTGVDPATLQLGEDLHKLALASKRKPRGRGSRFGSQDLISVGPLFKPDGGKDGEFIVFNQAAAENAFADVIKNETELSFYAK